ncbi:hypothetical protein HUU05_17510 [candidate division KSB1 bacterium]|nr:hypothetical protein [candidate division KSB1 bacterium]
MLDACKQIRCVQQRIEEALRETVVSINRLPPTDEIIIDNPPAPGSLLNKVRFEFDNVLKESDLESPRVEILKKKATHDGKPIVLDHLLKQKQDLNIVLDSGAVMCIRFFSGRPVAGQIPEGVLFRIALKDAPNEFYDVKVRHRAYTDLHVVLSNPKAQSLDLNGIKAGLYFLRGLGPGCSGFFNAAAPSFAKFHFQFFCEVLPLWKNIQDKTVSITPQGSHAVSDHVKVGALANWPFDAKVLSCVDVDPLAEATLSEVIDLRKKHSDYEYDLLLFMDSDELIHVALALRRGANHVKPKSFYPEKPEAYGDFGGLELSGLIVTIKDAQAFEHLKQL